MWLIYAILAAVTWGLSYTLDERVFRHISPLTLLACSMLIGGLIFSIMAYFFQLKSDMAILAQDKKLWGLILAAIAAANAGTLFIALSIQAKNATLAAIVELSYPLFTILFAWLIFKENYLNIKVAIGGILMLLGAALISFAG